MSETAKHNDGGPAFPFAGVAYVDSHDPGIQETIARTAKGMTLRDYFAGQALIGLLSARIAGEYEDTAWLYSDAIVFFNHANGEKQLAQLAYQAADAMLAARAAIQAGAQP